MTKPSIHRITNRLLALTSEETIFNASLSDYSRDVEEVSAACTQELMEYLTAKTSQKSSNKPGFQRGAKNTSGVTPRNSANRGKARPAKRGHRRHHITHKSPKKVVHPDTRCLNTIKPRHKRTRPTPSKAKGKHCSSSKATALRQTGTGEAVSKQSGQCKAAGSSKSDQAASSGRSPTSDGDHETENFEVQGSEGAKSECYSSDNYEEDFDETIEEGDLSAGKKQADAVAEKVSTPPRHESAAVNPIQVEADATNKLEPISPVVESAIAAPTSIPLTEEDKALMRGNWEPIAMDKPDDIAGDSYNPEDKREALLSSDEESGSYSNEEFEATDNYSPVQSVVKPPQQGNASPELSESSFLPDITKREHSAALMSPSNMRSRRQETGGSANSTSTGEFESLLQEFEGVSYGGNPAQVAAT